MATSHCNPIFIRGVGSLTELEIAIRKRYPRAAAHGVIGFVKAIQRKINRLSRELKHLSKGVIARLINCRAREGIRSELNRLINQQISWAKKVLGFVAEGWRAAA